MADICIFPYKIMARVRGIGVDDQDHVSRREVGMIARQKLHLADEGWIVRAVGKDEDRAQDVKQIAFDHLGRRDGREGNDLFGAGRNR